MDNIYEVIIGPPALLYPEPEPESTPPTNHRRLMIILAAVGAVLAVAALAVLTATNVSPKPVGTTTDTVMTPTVISVDPPSVKWVVPDIPDAENISVDERFIATLARHGVGPGPNGSRQAMIDGAHEICTLLAAGWTQQQVIDQLVESQSATIIELQFKMVVVTAIDLYCHK